VHARRVRPDTGHIDRRRLAAAGLSAVLPGLGQLFNGRRQLAAVFLVPSLILVLLGVFLFATQPTIQLAARAAAPDVLAALLTLNLILLPFRLLAVGQAFLDTRRPGPTSRIGIVGIAILLLLVVVPHAAAYRYGAAFGDTFARIFAAEGGLAGDGLATSRSTGPGADERLNILLLGIDKIPSRTATLSDTMMVASIDPVGKTVSLVSVPRDLIGVPLGNGDNFGPKLNSLLAYADRHPKDFPAGGVRALEDAIGALLGIKIHYYARTEFFGFVDMVDAVGGVDIVVTQGFDDPTYDGFGFGEMGYSITAGPHHLDGLHALAYARARKAGGESDFTRAARQQQVLLALRDAVTKDGSLLWELPQLLDAVGKTISSDVPVERLPELAAALDQIEDGSIVRAVIRHPLVRSAQTRYGSSLVPDLAAIRDVADGLFTEPGTEPTPWPTPEPTSAP
jgi:polyisoprenyl-teichoic acid--peptidoglycan teichoic acid transferase